MTFASVVSEKSRELRRKHVGVSDMKVSSNFNEYLVTYSLGSCIGLTLYDPVARVGGLLHCMMPLSRENAFKAEKNPFMFADTGTALLLKSLFARGATKRNLIAKVAGGAQAFEDKCKFRIGEKNYTVVRKTLWKNDILIAAESVGGVIPRNMFLYIDTGKTVISSQGQSIEL